MLVQNNFYEYPAKWIQNNVDQGSFSCQVKARLISTVVFPIFCALDWINHGIKGVASLAIYSFNPHKTSDQFTVICQELAVVEKTFRGAVLSPAGLYKPDAISYQFVARGCQAQGVHRCNLKDVNPTMANTIAQWVDFFNEKNTIFLAKIIGTTLLPVAFAFYVVRDILVGTWHFSQSLYGSSQIRQMHKDYAYMTFEGAVKHALGLLLSPCSLYDAGAVAESFLPNTDQVGHFRTYGEMYSTTNTTIQPCSQEEVQNAIRSAVANGKKISVGGARLSQAAVTLSNKPESVTIDLSKMNSIRIDEDEKTATVGASVIFKDLQREANKAGLAIKVMQATPVFSIGGSISANCHGWDHNAGTIGQTIKRMKIVDHKGDIQDVGPEHALFKSVVGGWGLFGVILEATIELADNTLMATTGVNMPVSKFRTFFNSAIKNHETMFRGRLSLDSKTFFKEIIVEEHRPISEKMVKDENLQEEGQFGSRYHRMGLQAARVLPSLINVFYKAEKSEAVQCVVQSRNQIMNPPVNGIFNNAQRRTEWLQEYFVSEENLEPFIQFLGQKLQDNDMPVFNATLRFVKADPSISFNYTKNKDCFAIVLWFHQSLKEEAIKKTRTWVQEAVGEVLRLDGSFYLPYPHLATKEQIDSAYVLRSIEANKKEFDPEGVFSHGLYEELTSLDVEEEV